MSLRDRCLRGLTHDVLRAYAGAPSGYCGLTPSTLTHESAYGAIKRVLSQGLQERFIMFVPTNAAVKAAGMDCIHITLTPDIHRWSLPSALTRQSLTRPIVQAISSKIRQELSQGSTTRTPSGLLEWAALAPEHLSEELALPARKTKSWPLAISVCDATWYLVRRPIRERSCHTQLTRAWLTRDAYARTAYARSTPYSMLSHPAYATATTTADPRRPAHDRTTTRTLIGGICIRPRGRLRGTCLRNQSREQQPQQKGTSLRHDAPSVRRPAPLEWPVPCSGSVSE